MFNVLLYILKYKLHAIKNCDFLQEKLEITRPLIPLLESSWDPLSASGILLFVWCFPLLNAGFAPKVSDTKSPADWMSADKPTELSRIKLKTWSRQPLPMISEHSAHSTPLSVGLSTWLWRYTYLLLLLSILWHRQVLIPLLECSWNAPFPSRILISIAPDSRT